MPARSHDVSALTRVFAQPDGVRHLNHVEVTCPASPSSFVELRDFVRGRAYPTP